MMSILEGRFLSGFENAAKYVPKIVDWVDGNRHFDHHSQKFVVDFVVRELFNNAVEHGNRNDGAKMISYRVESRLGFIEISVGDEGQGFDLEQAVRRDRESGTDSVRNRGLLIALKLGWTLSARGGTVTARYEYGRKGG